ncbi:hypothetical protein SLS64_013816 [Diaporthe eres]
MSTESLSMISDDSAAQEDSTVQIRSCADEQEATRLNFNHCYWPEDGNKVSCDDASPDQDSGSFHGVSENDSPTTTTWENSWAENTENSLSGWGIEGHDWCPEPIGGPPKENWREFQLRPESKSWLRRLSFGKPAHTLSDAEYNDLMDLHLLPLKTRLEDDDWLDSPLENVRVDDEGLFRLLTRGRELAQKCLWAYLDKNRPAIRRREYPGGWHQVKLEGNALMDALDSWALDFRQNSPIFARTALFAVVPLRHLTCHWTHGDLGWDRPAPRVVDGHLKNVQKLAIHLYDEECAAEARKLRDEARRAVEDTVSEIEALEPLFDEYQWKYHHEEMFEQIKHAKDMRTPDLYRYPDVIFRAAEAWSRNRSSDQIWDEEPRLQEDHDTKRNEPKTHPEGNSSGQEKQNAGNIATHALTSGTPSRRYSMPCRETASINIEQRPRGYRHSSISNF